MADEFNIYYTRTELEDRDENVPGLDITVFATVTPIEFGKCITR